ncbi:methyl-accepting chemotaxis protein [Colwellia sp. MEBiC06753]
MLNLSIKSKIIALAIIPLAISVTILSILSAMNNKEISDLSQAQMQASLYGESKKQLDTFIELAITSIAGVEDDEAKKVILRRLRYEGNANYYFVYDTSGTQVVSADQPEREGKNFIDSKSKEGRFLVREYIDIAKKGGGYVEYNWPRPNSTVPSPKIAKAAMIPGTDWVIATGFYIDDLQKKLDALNEANNETLQASIISSLIFAVVILVVMAGAALKLSQTITTPLNNVVTALDEIANGDGDLSKRLDTSVGHELGALATAFNVFADKISHLVREVHNSVSVLTQSSVNLSELMAQAEDGVNRQHAESDQVATAMNEMSATALDVAQSASNAAKAAQEAEQQVVDASDILDGTIQVINGLGVQVDEGVQVIGQLGEESKNIGGVIEVIRGIAEQTNLLALNAAIEAARAGEQGRGFAVVADEVRTLAARTASSTDEIQRMIVTLQNGTGQAVTAITKISEQSTHTVSEAGKVDEALREIKGSVTTINDMNNQIATAAEEQTMVSETINQNVHQIVMVAEETANGTTEAASISAKLNDIAVELEAIVGQYKT